MKKEELDLILKNHVEWLNNNGKECADLRYTNLQNVNLEGSNLQNVNLEDANLRYANLQNVNLRYANLQNVNLEGADLQGADLRNVNLEGVDLHGANLRNVNLKGVDLHGADLQYADLHGADLQGADLSQCNINKCSGFYSIDNIGTFNGKITFHSKSNQVWAGCWRGNLEEFKIKCKEVYGKKAHLKDELEICIKFFELKGLN